MEDNQIKEQEMDESVDTTVEETPDIVQSTKQEATCEQTKEQDHNNDLNTNQNQTMKTKESHNYNGVLWVLSIAVICLMVMIAIAIPSVNSRLERVEDALYELTDDVNIVKNNISILNNDATNFDDFISSIFNGNNTSYIPSENTQVAPFDNSPFLGLAFSDVNKISNGNGIVVDMVYPNSTAYFAGMKTGDILFGFNGTRIYTLDDLTEKIAETAPGDTVSLDFATMSDNGIKIVSVTSKMDARGNFDVQENN